MAVLIFNPLYGLFMAILNLPGICVHFKVRHNAKKNYNESLVRLTMAS